MTDDPRVVRSMRVGQAVVIEVPPSDGPTQITVTLIGVGPGQRAREAFDVPAGADVSQPRASEG